MAQRWAFFNRRARIMLPATITERIDYFASRHPERTAIIFGERSLTYAEFADASSRLAKVLRSSGVVPGERVCFLSHNCIDYLVFYHAVLRCGAALFPVNADLSASEVAYILRHATPVLVVSDEAHAAAMHEAMSRSGLTLPAAVLESLVRDASAIREAGAGRSRLPDDLAFVVYTSGTTAAPKGVPASDRIELRSADAFASAWQVGPQDLFVCALPLSFMFGLHTATMVAFSQGAAVLLFERFHPVRVLEAIETHRATVMLGVPTMYSMMLEHVTETGRRYKLGSVRVAGSSGAPLAVATRHALERACGLRVQDYYALSECRPIFSFDASAPEAVPVGSVGKAVPDLQVRFVDDDGRDVAPGETGAILVRSPTLIDSYFRDPERSRAAVTDGWFITGDLGRRDDAGYVYISGRTRDQVISSGQKISAIEVEDVLLEHAAVAQAAVVGVPDDKYGELLKAVIVLRTGEQVSEASLLEHCRSRLAAYKLPRRFSFRDSLPVSPAGKVLKRELIHE